MLSDEQLEDVLGDLQGWYFWKDADSSSYSWRVTDLLVLPQPFIDKIKTFISRYSIDELKEFSPDDFIKESTDKSPKIISDLISKLREYERKRANIEKDFV